MQEGKREEEEDDGTGLTLKDLKLMFPGNGTEFLAKVEPHFFFSPSVSNLGTSFPFLERGKCTPVYGITSFTWKN